MIRKYNMGFIFFVLSIILCLFMNTKDIQAAESWEPDGRPALEITNFPSKNPNVNATTGSSISNKDTYGPVVDISSIEISKKKVETGDIVKLSMSVTDESEITSVRVSYDNTTTGGADLDLFYNSQTGKYETELEIDDNTGYDWWYLLQIWCKDSIGNTTHYWDEITHIDDKRGDLSNGNFYRVDTGKMDFGKPRADLSSINVSSRIVGDEIEITVSLIARASVYSPIKNVLFNYLVPFSQQVIQIILEYNQETGRYESSFIINKNSKEIGIWKLTSIGVYNENHRYASYHSNDYFSDWNCGIDLSIGNFSYKGLASSVTEVPGGSSAGSTGGSSGGSTGGSSAGTSTGTSSTTNPNKPSIDEGKDKPTEVKEKNENKIVLVTLSDTSNQVISDAIQKEDGTFADKTGKTITNAIVKLDDDNYIVDEKGAILENTLVTLKDGTMYYCNKDGLVANNLVISVNKDKYVCTESGEIAKDTITTVNKKKYYSDENGKVVKNAVVTFETKKYFATASGKLAVSQICNTKDGLEYYATKTGELAKNTLVEVSKKITYYAKADGTFAYSEIVISPDGKEYYATASGRILKSKWVKKGNVKYYCNKNGVITKKVEIKK